MNMHPILLIFLHLALSPIDNAVMGASNGGWRKFLCCFKPPSASAEPAAPIGRAGVSVASGDGRQQHEEASSSCNINNNAEIANEAATFFARAYANLEKFSQQIDSPQVAWPELRAYFEANLSMELVKIDELWEIVKHPKRDVVEGEVKTCWEQIKHTLEAEGSEEEAEKRRKELKREVEKAIHLFMPFGIEPKSVFMASILGWKYGHSKEENQVYIRMYNVKQEVRKFMFEIQNRSEFNAIKNNDGHLPFFAFRDLVNLLTHGHEKTGSIFAFKRLGEVDVGQKGDLRPIVGEAARIFDGVRASIQNVMEEFIDHFGWMKTQMSEEVKGVMDRTHPDPKRIEVYRKERALKKLEEKMLVLVKTLDGELGMKLEIFENELETEGAELATNIKELALNNEERKEAFKEYEKFQKEFMDQFQIKRDDDLFDEIVKAYGRFQANYLETDNLERLANCMRSVFRFYSLGMYCNQNGTNPF